MPTKVNGTDNSVSAPAIVGTDTTTGIYFPTTAQVAFSISGSQVGLITSTGLSNVATINVTTLNASSLVNTVTVNVTTLNATSLVNTATANVTTLNSTTLISAATVNVTTLNATTLVNTATANVTTLNATTIVNPSITNFTETPVSIGNSGTTQTLSLANGTFQSVTLNGNCTFTMPTATNGKSFILIVTQDATGGRTATFTSVKWPAGSAPTITTTASTGRDILAFFADGTNWYGAVAQAFA